MQKLSLDALARELLSRATNSGASGAAGGSRAAQTVVGGQERIWQAAAPAASCDAGILRHTSHRVGPPAGWTGLTRKILRPIARRIFRDHGTGGPGRLGLEVDRAGVKGVKGLGYAAFLEAEMGLEDRREAVEFPPECRRRSNGPRRQQLADLLEDRGH